MHSLGERLELLRKLPINIRDIDGLHENVLVTAVKVLFKRRNDLRMRRGEEEDTLVALGDADQVVELLNGISIHVEDQRWMIGAFHQYRDIIDRLNVVAEASK